MKKKIIKINFAVILGGRDLSFWSINDPIGRTFSIWATKYASKLSFDYFVGIYCFFVVFLPFGNTFWWLVHVLIHLKLKISFFASKFNIFGKTPRSEDDFKRMQHWFQPHFASFFSFPSPPKAKHSNQTNKNWKNKLFHLPTHVQSFRNLNMEKTLKWKSKVFFLLHLTL